ncbi:manganese efflux pump MntP family protein [candidate division CSSED10-310 bacterium]|uniref:Putative manganese efflux pump MntP n=1 Tax=candidate division CSSED10-310 bacterium TaxID=2855610 RepID=A0ABV6YU14_UNCC1
MEIITSFGIAVALGMDALAVGIVVGMMLTSITFRHFFRLTFHFGFFQCFMTLLGWLAGNQIIEWVAPIDHWIAFGLLSIIGGRMITDQDNAEESMVKDPTRGWSLVMLSIATSIDALTVGLSIGAMGLRILSLAILIGIIASIMTFLGMAFGKRIGLARGKKMEIGGGIILIIIGFKILIEHLLDSSF